MISEPKFLKGWDAEPVKTLIDHYEGLPEDDMTAEDEEAVEVCDGQTVITVPDELLPAIRQLISGNKSA